MKKLLSFKAFVLYFLVAIALAVRLYGVNNSLTEWFSWRQSDTAAVGRFLIKDNFNLLKPRYYDLSDIQSGHNNPQGYRMVEFPLYNAIFAKLHQLFNALPLEVWARITTVFFSLAVLLVLYYLLQREFGMLEAFFGALFFAVSPYVVFYSRSILPDMPAVSLSIIGIFFMYRFHKQGLGNFIAGSIFFALALLVKPTVIFNMLPAVYLIARKNETVRKKLLYIIAFCAVAFVPMYLWRLYIQGFPEGVPASDWLLTSVNTPQGLQNIFLRPAFFRWIFFERINNMILGGYLTVFLVMGFLSEQKNKLFIHLVMAFAATLFLFTFQGGNVQHDYYQIFITPAVALLVGAGCGQLLRVKRLGVAVLRWGIVVILFSLSLFFSYYQIRGNYTQNEDLIFIANVIRSFTNEKEIIVTDTMGDTTLLYLSDRRGYPAPYRDFETLKTQGAGYFITRDTNYKETLKGKYKLLFENDKVLIFAL